MWVPTNLIPASWMSMCVPISERQRKEFCYKALCSSPISYLIYQLWKLRQDPALACVCLSVLVQAMRIILFLTIRVDSRISRCVGEHFTLGRSQKFSWPHFVNIPMSHIDKLQETGLQQALDHSARVRIACSASCQLCDCGWVCNLFGPPFFHF